MAGKMPSAGPMAPAQSPLPYRRRADRFERMSGTRLSSADVQCHGIRIMRLGFVGTGTIAAAIIEGLFAADGAHSITVSPRNAEVAADLAARFANVRIAPTNQAVLDASDVVFLAVRPQIADGVLRELRFRPDHHVISLIAAI